MNDFEAIKILKLNEIYLNELKCQFNTIGCSVDNSGLFS